MTFALGHAIMTDLSVYGQGTSSFTDSNVTGANPSVPWSSTINIGTASADRIIVVGAQSSDSNSGRTITSIQIGGVSMTTLINIGTGGQADAWICALKVTTGTTATLKVSAGATNTLGAFVWALYGFPRGEWLLASSDSSGTAGATWILDVPVNAHIFGAGVSNWVNSSTPVGTGIDVDGFTNVSNVTKRWGGHQGPSNANDYSRAISITNFTGTRSRSALVSLLPPAA